MRISPQHINTIVSATNGMLIGNNKRLATNISIDSRSQTIDENTLFIALKGEHKDGHQFIKEAYKKGCRIFITNQEIKLKEVSIIVVENTLQALQDLAKQHRSTLTIPVIGITGSYGKTTVKEWLYQLLQDKFNIARSPKSYNSQIGVPLSILSIMPSANLAIIEAGISKPGEMQKLARIIQPTIGVFTGIGKAHEENFSSLEEKKQEKFCLFNNAEKIITDKDITLEIKLPFTDKSSIQNAKIACIVAEYFGLSKEEIQQKAKSLKALALRMEIAEGKRNNIVVNDSYNSDENGLELALEFLKQKSEGKQTMVVSTISSNHSEKLKKLYAINDWVNIQSEKDKTEFLKKINKTENTAILIKGTQDSFFQKISQALQKTNHTTALEIDLSAITHNVQTFKNLLKPSTKLMLMVKAFGYGSGSVELAKHLEKLGVDYFGVAYASEGEQLRKAKVKTPIMVLSPEQSSFSTIIEHQLEPEIYSLDVLEAFIRALISYNKKEYPIHIKVDTGMNRQGFQQHEIQEMCQTIIAQPEVRVASVFSHLAASDEPEQEAFTLKQIKYFEEINLSIENEIGQTYTKHILNTHGIINNSNYQYNMVRLGIGLFGEDFSGKLKRKLQNVASFKTTITQIKEVKKGQSIGYGRNTILTEDKTIGILPVGYADGYFRALSNKAEVYVNGQKASVIGNVCMDITMIDLTQIEAKLGDKVELFGTNIPLAELAKKANTIPYEILTSISARVKRVYLSE